MSYKDKISRIIGVLALVIAIIGIFTPAGQSVVKGALGGVSNYDTIGVTGLQVGPGCNGGGTCTGSTLSFVSKGTCFLIANTSITASTTQNVDCAYTGVVAGDTVIASLQASSTNASNYIIRGVQASTTAGFITFSLLNQTGTSAVPAATNGMGSSTSVTIFR